jgi:hypothetical protein
MRSLQIHIWTIVILKVELGHGFEVEYLKHGHNLRQKNLIVHTNLRFECHTSNFENPPGISRNASCIVLAASD